MKITDEAVKAAVEYYSEGGCMGLDEYERKEVARDMIEAALPQLQPVDVVDNDGSMTPEEHRLEDLKQMAAYSGAIVSFEVNEPYYLASCNHCGWVGSSELCGTDSFGDDSDVYCPRCHSSGADCGEVAERINCKPVDVAAVREQCAQIAERFTNREHITHDMKAGIFPSQSKTGVAIAAAIRAHSPAVPTDRLLDIKTADCSKQIIGWGRRVGFHICYHNGKQWQKTELSSSFQLGCEAITHWVPLPAAPTSEAEA